MKMENKNSSDCCYFLNFNECFERKCGFESYCLLGMKRIDSKDCLLALRRPEQYCKLNSSM